MTTDLNSYIVSVLEEVRDLIQGYADVRDGSDGPRPNDAMIADNKLDEAIMLLKTAAEAPVEPGNTPTERKPSAEASGKPGTEARHQLDGPNSEAQRYRNLIVEHNLGCIEACGNQTSHQYVRDSRRCDSRRDCPDCPLDWVIDLSDTRDATHSQHSEDK